MFWCWVILMTFVFVSQYKPLLSVKSLDGQYQDVGQSVKLIYYRVIQIRLIHLSGSARGLLQSSKLFSKYSWWNIFIMWICVLTASKQVGPVLWLLLVMCFFNENQNCPGETVSTCEMLITTGHIVSRWNF